MPRDTNPIAKSIFSITHSEEFWISPEASESVKTKLVDKGSCVRNSVEMPK